MLVILLVLKVLGRTKKFRDLYIFNPKELLCKFEDKYIRVEEDIKEAVKLY